jgi:hypothetical protein
MIKAKVETTPAIAPEKVWLEIFEPPVKSFSVH